MLRKEQSFISKPKEIFNVRTYLDQYTPRSHVCTLYGRPLTWFYMWFFLSPIKLDISNISIYHELHYFVSPQKKFQSYGTDYFDVVIRPYCCPSCKLHHLSCMTILAKWNITKLKTKDQAIKSKVSVFTRKKQCMIENNFEEVKKEFLGFSLKSKT